MLDEVLKKRRAEMKLTQQEVAEKLNVARQTVSSWETGKSYPDIPTLILISNLYDLSLDFMLKGDTQYMKEVEKDYQLLENVKKTKWLDRTLIGTLIVLLLPLLFLPFAQNEEQMKIPVIIMIVAVMPMMILSYIKYKTFYSAYKGKDQPLFVPKIYGFGLSINPNRPLGKAIWYVLFVVVFVVLIFAVTQIL